MQVVRKYGAAGSEIVGPSRGGAARRNDGSEWERQPCELFTGPCQRVLTESPHFYGLFLISTGGESQGSHVFVGGGVAGRQRRRTECARKAYESGPERSDALGAPHSDVKVARRMSSSPSGSGGRVYRFN